MAKRGFTLIEMVVVLAILSIGLLGVSYTMNFVRKVRFQTCIKEVQQCIEMAQTRASLQNKKYSVVPRITNRQQVINVEANQEIKRQIIVPSGVEVECNSEKISFNGDLSPDQAGTLFLTHHQLGERVEIRVRPVTGEMAVYYFSN